MNGLLIVNKPSGMTSHDVVNTVRRITKVRRVGHTGTLDPLATGVLVLMIGPATRLARFIGECKKVYRAVVRLGEATATYDAEGDITERHAVHVTIKAIETALDQFRGTIEQRPPMYSAIKVKGQKLYQLARQGKEIERALRPITIYQLDVLDWTSPNLMLEVACSAGTYIRSLAHDLGQVLGCGAHLKALTRTAVGDFGLDQSYTLETLRVWADEGRIEEALLPPGAALSTLPAVQLTPAQEQAVRYGQAITPDAPPDVPFVQAHDIQGSLVAVLIPGAPGTWRPKIVLPEVE